MTKEYFLDLDIPAIKKSVAALGVEAFRGRQIIKWVYEKKAPDFDAFTNLAPGLRAKLKDTYDLRTLKIKAKKESRKDGTIRYNFLTRDGLTISSVFLPYVDRNSVCISTQAGCPVDCSFCATGKSGYKRNLTRGEILEQVLQVENDTQKKITGILLMGMGEPLLNYENTVSAVKAMLHPDLFGIGRRHITISTVGMVPQIKKLAAEDIGVKLAFSMHSADDALRSKFVPPHKVPYMVEQILEACIAYSRKTKSRLTIEYIMISGVNDSLSDAKKLAKLILGNIKEHDQVQINLIPCNAVGKAGGKPPYARTSYEEADKFKALLLRNNLLTLVREPRGADIGAACGQLGVE
jgi:23S rRNA (adenine2503-C2)-methyltransferase